MSKNEVFEHGSPLQVPCTHPTTPVSGGAVRCGDLVGVALTAEDATSARTTVTFEGVHMLSVKGVDAGGNAAIAAYARLYYVDADTPVLSAKVAGRFAGWAWPAIVDGTTHTGAVDSGATTTIPVRLAGTGTGIPA